jgi:SulP family sulfate permease
MPPYHGLYAALLPVAIGVLWGSSRQLATGPVAMVSLLTGATLAQFAAVGSEQFVACAIVLALMVGLLQLALGLARLGAIVSFVSHPVIAGFTSAAAIIIALSQLNKLLGLPIGRSEHFLLDIAEMLAQVRQTHLPTLAMGCGAIALMLACRRFAPRLPAVLIAAAAATALSWATGFERNETARVGAIADDTARGMAEALARVDGQRAEWERRVVEATGRLDRLRGSSAAEREARLAQQFEIEALRARIREAEQENRGRLRALRQVALVRETAPEGRFFFEDAVPAGVAVEPTRWRVQKVSGENAVLRGGGEVVGAVPRGLPQVRAPRVTWELLLALLPTALVITLVGFMEAVSVGKAMAIRTRQRLDASQELIGQGLANVAASLTQSFPVSGSISRSAVNLAAGAVTGMSSLFTFALVLATLLILTPLLYHMPQAVLAAIIVMAVANLVNFSAMRHAWQAHRHDGVAAVVTFVATLALAPHLDLGILLGAGLAVVFYLYRSMRPRVALLSRHADGTLRDYRAHGLPSSDQVVVFRFDGDLYFANVPYFEDAILEAVAARPAAKHLLIVGDGINEIDASGEETIRRVVERLRQSGLEVAFSGLKPQVLRVMQSTGLYALIGERCLFRTEDAALEAILEGRRDAALSPRHAA